MNLLIVESPNKIKKLKSFLGTDWEVGASAGHIRDIPGSNLGIDRENGTYAISYGITEQKEDLVNRLKGLVNHVGKPNVWLATDPDREGEGIAFHLCEVLGLNPRTTKRVTFMEITEAAVKAALAQPRLLDQDLVAAQEGRRAIDRLVGWEVSPALINSQPRPAAGVPNYSAGRVQSVAARLVVEVEEAIAGFAAGSGLSFPMSGTFLTPAGETLPARLVGKSAATETEARATLTTLAGTSPWRVLSVVKSPVLGKALPAYSTSTLQQDGVKKLKLTVKQVSDLSQKLFEDGHITYIRTDSVNIGPEGTAEALAQITSQYGAEYAQQNHYKEKDGVQGGHEAIRPTHWDVKTAGNDEKERALYKLIYERTLASQMAPARYDQTVVTVGTESGAAGPRFESRVKVLTFPGYRAAYQEAEEEEPAGDEGNAEGAEGATLRTPVEAGQPLTLATVQAVGRMQKPPKRYDEATLVADLEKRQIGRPSTYANIIATIFNRQYVQMGTVAGKKVPTITLSWAAGTPATQLKETSRTETLGADKNKLVPTERGRLATQYLKLHFGELVDYSFTATCEESLDAIAEGRSTYQQLLRDFDQRLLVQKAGALKANPPRAAARLVGEWNGLPILANTTKFGPALRYGPVGQEKTYGLRAGQDPQTITLAEAIVALEYGMSHKMRLVGEYEKKPINGGITKNEKPYLRWNDEFYNLPDGVELDLLTPEMARVAVATQVQGKAAAAAAREQARASGLVIQLDKKWSIYRHEDGSGVLMLTNGTDRCKLGKVTETEAISWDLDKAKKEMKRVLDWRKNNPMPARK